MPRITIICNVYERGDILITCKGKILSIGKISHYCCGEMSLYHTKALLHGLKVSKATSVLIVSEDYVIDIGSAVGGDRFISNVVFTSIRLRIVESAKGRALFDLIKGYLEPFAAESVTEDSCK